MTDETAPGGATPDAAAAAGPAAASVEAAARKGVFVPRWLAILLGCVVVFGLVGGGGFALGRSTADDDNHERVEDHRVGPPGLPPLGDRDGRGSGNGGNDGRPGGGSGGSTPTLPSPTSGVYLGVAVARERGTDGARVIEVVSGSPADDAGLEVGDVITAVDDTTVADAAALATAIQDYNAGDEVTITYDRDGASATAEVSLAERAESGFRSTSPPA
jgi:membrane-associated protease RseP (regulator of RpoE activity)